MSNSRLETLFQKLGHQFARPELLEVALTHPSVGTEADYERLEFLGDRVLGVVIADWLFKLYPAEPEGDLAVRFNELVRREQLATVSRQLGLGQYMRIGKGEAEALRQKVALLADICEAVIAALYLDAGIEAASTFIHNHWAGTVEAQKDPPKDAKSELQEWAMSRGLPLPEYREIQRHGPEHALIFTMEVAVEGQPPKTGTGSSKKIAEGEAAAALLRVLMAAV